jgi:hypothetical protein
MTRSRFCAGLEAACGLAGQIAGAAADVSRPGRRCRLELGVICSDATGTNRLPRIEWATMATGLVNDVPGEITPTPTVGGSAARNAGGGRT